MWHRACSGVSALILVSQQDHLVKDREFISIGGKGRTSKGGYYRAGHACRARVGGAKKGRLKNANA